MQTVSNQIAQNAGAATITDLKGVSTQTQALQVFLAPGIQLVRTATDGAGLTEAAIASSVVPDHLNAKVADEGVWGLRLHTPSSAVNST